MSVGYRAILCGSKHVDVAAKLALKLRITDCKIINAYIKKKKKWQME